MKRWLIPFMVGCLAFAGVASAAVQQGDTELDFLGAWMSQNFQEDGDMDSLFVMGRLGYFMTDNVQVSVGAFGSWNEVDLGDGYTIYDEEFEEEVSIDLQADDVEINVYGLGAGVKYHFMPTNQWVPYIGAQVFWVNVEMDVTGTRTVVDGEETDTGSGSLVDSDDDGMLWGPVAGMRYELNAYNDFFVEYQYHIWDGDIGDILDDGHLLFVGLIHQFK